jgi:hypothetical protein
MHIAIASTSFFRGQPNFHKHGHYPTLVLIAFTWQSRLEMEIKEHIKQFGFQSDRDLSLQAARLPSLIGPFGQELMAFGKGNASRHILTCCQIADALSDRDEAIESKRGPTSALRKRWFAQPSAAQPKRPVI